MTKLVVFDVDGTILNSFETYKNTVAEYSKSQGLPHPCLETIKRGYGEPHAHDFGWGVSREAQVEHLIASFRLSDKNEMSGEAHLTPDFFHGVEEALSKLKDDGHTLAIVTARPEAPLLHLLEYHNMGRFFSAHRTMDDARRRGEKEKPAPDMLLSVMRELKFEPEVTAMVGDTTMDICMGVAAGAHTIGVTWGMHPKDVLLDAGAHHIVETTFIDVVPVVKKIFG